jgi:signal transduction histidine kinase
MGGVGLGLSIGRWIAEVHAGTIEVQSAPGRGSIFQIRLPLAQSGG